MGDITGDYRIAGGEQDERVHAWEAGLPNFSDLPPLTKTLIPPELLSAFDIRPEPCRTSGDVFRASQDTVSTIRGSDLKFSDEEREEEGSESKKPRRNSSPEDDDSSATAKALKRTRLVWTPQLHKRFVEVVAHLGIKNAVPKTIMQLMNVEGLTRENVASHLQKYRLYLKRMQGDSFDGPSNSSEQLFSSSPAPENLPENRNLGLGLPISMAPYGSPMMPMMGMGMGMGMGMKNYMNGFESHQHQINDNQFNYHHNHHHYHHQYNGIMQAGNNNRYGSSAMNYYQHLPPHVAPGGN